jgi:ABC-2 type transport system ATP-binding protein
VAFVEIENLRKQYSGKWALRGISLDVLPGRVVGVLGENGSGKSTLFRILAGVTRPTSGSVRIDGMQVGIQTKRIVSYLPEIDPFYPWMAVGELLDFLSTFFPGWDSQRTNELLSLMDLPSNEKVGALSRGQRGRLKVVFAFSWPSALVLMDEPLGGIDMPSRKRILSALFGEYRDEGQTILISTHLVPEVEDYIEDVVYVRDGELVLSGSVDSLRQERGKTLTEIFEEVTA